LLCMGQGLRAQSWTVVHASPKVKSVATGKALAAGDRLEASAQVNLGDAAGRVVVWDEKEGILLLGAQKVGEKQWKTSGKAAELKQVLPAITVYPEHITSLAALQQHFHGRKYLLLGKSWLVADAPFRVGGDTVLFYKYERIATDVEVSRKVERRGDSLLLEPRFILDMNGQAVPASDARNFQLYWLDMKTKGYSQLARFEFVFADEAMLEKEVGMLLGLVGAARGASAGKEDMVGQFLTAAYGSVDGHNLRVWMAQRFGE
jgi:hypothetical protein